MSQFSALKNSVLSFPNFHLIYYIIEGIFCAATDSTAEEKLFHIFSHNRYSLYGFVSGDWELRERDEDPWKLPLCWPLSSGWVRAASLALKIPLLQFYQCAVSPGTVLKEMMLRSTGTWHTFWARQFQYSHHLKKHSNFGVRERVKTLICIEGNAHSLALCCAQQVVITDLIRLVRPLTFQKGVQEPWKSLIIDEYCSKLTQGKSVLHSFFCLSHPWQ